MKTNSSMFVRAVTVGLMALGAAAASALAGGPPPEWDISWSTVDGGGGSSFVGDWRVSGTIAQHDVGPAMASGDFAVAGGYWAPGVLSTDAVVFNCPADIAQTDAGPGPDGLVDNGDFSLFFTLFFSADCTGTCPSDPVVQCNLADIAQSDATQGSDGCVDNGDFSLFFSSFFAGCP